MADTLAELTFEEILPGVEVAELAAAPKEVKVVRLKKGAAVPAHTHTGNVIHLIVSGSLVIGGKTYGVGALYNCGGWEYRAQVPEDTVMLLIQDPDTTFNFKDK